MRRTGGCLDSLDIVGGYRAASRVRQAAFFVFACTALIVIVHSVSLLLLGPAALWPVAGAGVLCAAVLELSWFRVGPAAHRSPVVCAPALALPALVTVVPEVAAVGLIALGVLLIILVESRRPSVAIYDAGLVASAGLVAVGLVSGFRSVGVPGTFAVAGACGGYVVFVIVVEVLRMRYTPSPVDFPVRSMLSPTRIVIVVLGTGGLAFVAARSAVHGTPFAGETGTAVEVLITLTLAGVVLKVTTYVVGMRGRLAGLIAGAKDLSADAGELPQSESTAHVVKTLCRAVGDAIGVASVSLRTEPPGRGDIGVPITLTAGVNEYIVARRDVMDDAFTVSDLDSLAALAHTAEIVVKARNSIGGLTIRANTDPLTGLPNYGAFQAALTNINEHRDYSEAIAVLFIDLDDFKRMNDRHGHQVGDGILSELGRRLGLAVRPHDVVARVGGDEFVVILTHLGSLAEANAIAERIMAATGEPLTVDTATVTPVVSIGLAYSAHRETDVNALVKDADRSMLAIKKSRRRGGPAKESSINISGHRSSEMNDIVARAIDEDLLQLAFQPIVSLVTEQIWAFEALVRYTHPELGPLSPSSLVEKAKGLGRLDLLTRQVAVKAMAAATEFRLLDPRISCMTINVEAGQILPERVGDFVEELAERYPGISLCLELNERSMSRVTPAIRAQADHLRDIGLMIALDDYGSQDSSVDALVRMPMDILKIDRSLVDDLDDVRQREVLTALQGFGDNLEYSMVVEGVENERMAEHLGALGIRSAQGFHYGTAQSFENIVARLEEFGAQAVLPPGVVDASGTRVVRERGSLPSGFLVTPTSSR